MQGHVHVLSRMNARDTRRASLCCRPDAVYEAGCSAPVLPHHVETPGCAAQEDGTVMGPGSHGDEREDGSSDDDVAAAVQAMAAKASQQEVSVRTGPPISKGPGS